MPTSQPIDDRVEPIGDDVVRIALPLPLPDLKTVNAYVVTGGDGITLIDPGWADADSETALRAALDRLHFAVSDVRRILVTHQHWDHYSLGVTWRDRYGIELLLGREERHSIAAYDPADGVHPRQVPKLRAAGAPALADEVAALVWEPYERGIAFTPPDRWLDDGDVVDCGGVQIVARATPGHTRGHVVFDHVAGGVVFTGDHLLPRITPSIAFERDPEYLPLRSYLSSLQLFVDFPDARMLPAHGATDGSTRSRASALLEHHRERLTLVGDLVAAGASTAFEVAGKMVWTRRRRSRDELETVHRMTAVLEVQSHLDLLVARGILTGQDCEGVALFAPA